MPHLTTPDYLAMFLQPGPTQYLRPYKLSRVKRAAEIALIFEGTVSPTGTGGGYGAQSTCNVLDRDGLARRPNLTDNYQLSVLPGIGPNDPIFVERLAGADGFNEARDLNKDTTPNRGNIRFRHKGDTLTNCLMLDGHVQSFTFNPRNKKTDLLRNNVYVNR
jgi:prepilin-type processing-associated H-X9-DG protein